MKLEKIDDIDVKDKKIRKIIIEALIKEDYVVNEEYAWRIQAFKEK